MMSIDVSTITDDRAPSDLRREIPRQSSHLQQQPLNHPCKPRHRSHEDVIQGGQVFSSGCRTNAEPLVLERDHFLAASRGSVAATAAAVQQPSLASDDGHPGGDRRRHRRGWPEHRRGRRGWHSHVRHSGREIELTDAARHKILEMQRALLLTMLLMMV